VIEEDEGPHHPVLGEGQYPADFKTAPEIATPLVDNHVNQRSAPDCSS
jgi:hypothetical protein